MVLEVYLDPATINCRKVLAGLDLMNVKYDEHFINYFKGEQKSEDYVKNINPNATIPSAKDGDLIITESNAILQYAADAYGPSAAYPTDLKKRADVNRWLLWEASAWFPQCYIYIVQNVVQPLLGNKPDPATLEAAHPRFHHLAKTMDGPLGKTKFLCGNEPTIADIAVAAPMHVHWAQKLPLDEHPNIKRWMGDVEKLPAWVKTQDAVTKGLGLAGQVSNLRGSGPTVAATNGSHPADRQDVKANFNYTKDVTPKLTELYFYESEKATGIHEPGDDPHVMSVTDGWQHAKDFTLDKNGFAVSDFSTAFSEWEEEQVVRDKFYPEVVDFLKRTTGASRILVFDHTIRSKANQAKKLTQETNTSQRAPVTLVHCDYTAESGPTRVQQLLPEEAGALLSRRVAFYNVWKPIHRTVEEHPLAMCDVTSSPPDDFFKLHLRYRDRDGENYVMRHNDAHHWWYFPHMTPEQVILLKTYDSMTDGRARFVGHSAFIDPTSPPDAPTRESVEIRTIAFYDS